MEPLTLYGTGLTGLIGSKFLSDFQTTYDCLSLSSSHPDSPVDITHYDELAEAVSQKPAQYMLHLAAFTDVTKAWEQKGDKTGSAYQLNVVGTENVIKVCQEFGLHLIYVSTAYVFDGTKEEPYLEFDPVSPIEWYGQTKAEAEDRVMNADLKWTVLRIDQPFRSDPFPKKDVAHKIIEGLKNNTLNPQFTNHHFGPTFIDDFVKVIDWVIRTQTTGLYHASSGEMWTDFDFATEIKTTLQLSGEVKPGDLTEYLQTINRPYQRNTALNCSKLQQELDFKQFSIPEAIRKITL